MKQLPVSLFIKNRPCLVVGGGNIAERKVGLLLKAGGMVTVLSPRLNEQLSLWASEGTIDHWAKRFEVEDIGRFILIIASTDDRGVNSAVAKTAREKNIPVNVVDQPDLCTFTIPSIVDRSPVSIAVSTGGASPVLARMLRARLETMIPSAYGSLAELLNEYRQEVIERFPDTKRRRNFWEYVLHGPISELLFSGNERAARDSLIQAIQSERPESNLGEVYLVGAGPGDPDLLTFRALRLMQQADVVLHDRLVSPEILGLVRKDASRIYVGKQRSEHPVPQPCINDQLLTLAQQGKRVLRLKGGDPFIFGRGGEEIVELAKEGIPFQVVPGITAASGCASYAGIPLTHRDYAQSCIFVTGHLKDGSVDLNWKMLAQPRQTVVIYMGLIGLPVICEQLIGHGMDSNTPAALVEQGTTNQQRVMVGSLSTLPTVVEQGDIRAPTLIIVGGVVNLHATLSWFEPVPANE